MSMRENRIRLRYANRALVAANILLIGTLIGLVEIGGAIVFGALFRFPVIPYGVAGAIASVALFAVSTGGAWLIKRGYKEMADAEIAKLPPIQKPCNLCHRYHTGWADLISKHELLALQSMAGVGTSAYSSFYVGELQDSVAIAKTMLAMGTKYKAVPESDQYLDV